MEQYIKKSALLTEIKRIIKTNKECMLGLRNLDYYQGRIDALNDTLSSLDTLEVKAVDLEKELKEDWLFADKTEVDCLESMCLTEDMFVSLAKKYFQLGMCANNPITATDRGTAEEIIINLKRVEKDYRINLTREIEWLRNKVKKGK